MTELACEVDYRRVRLAESQQVLIWLVECSCFPSCERAGYKMNKYLELGWNVSLDDAEVAGFFKFVFNFE